MDLSKIKELKDLQLLLDLMGQHDLVELEIEVGGQKVRLRKAEPAPPREIISFASPAAAQAPATPSASLAADLPAVAGGPALEEIASPMVGSFYRAPSPEAEPYVREGDAVQPETTLCIIEAMKVMNEIPAGVSGVIREILVKNGESVEYGQPLFRVESE